MHYRPRRCLVTGGAGFIGAHFVHHILMSDPSARIVNLDALTYAADLNRLDRLADMARHTFVEGNICDRALLDRVLSEHCIDTVVHFAAETHVDRSIAGAEAFIRTNVLGTFNLLEAVRHYWMVEQNLPADELAGKRRFHHVSTDEVYGALQPGDRPFTESSHYAPNSPYSASKASSDHLVRASHHTYGLPVTLSHSSNNYGVGQHAEKFIPAVIIGASQGHPVPIYGDGQQIRDWLHVEDHCAGIERVLRYGAPGQSYNIGAQDEYPNMEVARLICKTLDSLRPDYPPHDRWLTHVTDRPGHDRRYALDTHRISTELDWRPQHRLARSILALVEDCLHKTHAARGNHVPRG